MQGCKKFPNVYEPSQNSRPQKCDMNEVSNSGSTNVRRYRTKFSHHGDLAPGICAPLLYFTFSTVYETDPSKELLTSSRAIKLVPQTAHLLFMSALYHEVS